MIYRAIFAMLIFSFVAAFDCSAQETQKADAPVKIVTEEIRLNVTAQNSAGHFDETVVKDDLLVVEDGVPQKIESLRRVPASVLLLLDTGGELYFAKNLITTRETAKTVVQNLNGGETLAAMLYNDKPELISDWTENRKNSLQALNRKLYTGQRARLAAAITAAIVAFQTRPSENRHLVLITDGMESAATASEQESARQNLTAANITVHIVSYTQLEAEQARKAMERFKSAKIKSLVVMAAGLLSPDIRTARRAARAENAQ